MPPGKHLAVAQKFLIETDAARARAIGRAELAMHLAMPNYIAHFQRIGFAPAELDDGGSDRLIDALVNWGTVDDVKRRIRAHFDGRRHPCLHPPAARPRRLRRARCDARDHGGSLP